MNERWLILYVLFVFTLFGGSTSYFQYRTWQEMHEWNASVDRNTATNLPTSMETRTSWGSAKYASALTFREEPTRDSSDVARAIERTRAGLLLLSKEN